MQELSDALLSMRSFFQSGATRHYDFRIKQLQSLKKAVLRHEGSIQSALYADLKKSPEESFVTETGLILAEINTALKNLREWMAPEKVPTNLVNLPSSSMIYRDPLGVVLIIAPWNFPVQLSLIPLAGAIAGGNCAVIKPSEMAPASARVLGEIIGEAFDAGYVRLVEGDGAEVVPALMQSFRFDHVFFTGSIPVGKIIYELAARQLVPVTLELGGKSPVIVEKNADLETAARRIAAGKFTNAGQTCIAPDYVLVQDRVKEKFLAHLKKAISQFYTDDPAGSYDYGKIINEKRFDTLTGYLRQGKVTYGGKHNRQSLFLGPTILEEVPLEATVMKEEIFGPVLPVFGYASREEALSIINRNPDPLALYLFTNSKASEKEWVSQISFGGGCINNADWHFANHHLPFGGVAFSGTGAYHGRHSFETFTRAKSIMKTPNWFDPYLKYPPLKGRLRLFKWLFR